MGACLDGVRHVAGGPLPVELKAQPHSSSQVESSCSSPDVVSCLLSSWNQVQYGRPWGSVALPFFPPVCLSLIGLISEPPSVGVGLSDCRTGLHVVDPPPPRGSR